MKKIFVRNDGRFFGGGTTGNPPYHLECIEGKIHYVDNDGTMKALENFTLEECENNVKSGYWGERFIEDEVSTTVTFRPSMIYKDREKVEKILNGGWQIVGFKVPVNGDTIISQDYCVIKTIQTYLPRFIIKPLNNTNLDKFWPKAN